ncbi:hypothetical protein DIURU_005263 [Diutina rugosa]|uniref:Ribosome biogenesis protein SLX9 n=1 Tax=Diutina rugosa TaxID=5481 RepID=A0A642UHZ1_DIURU|nr:uncharacterized protein DIURU_005263 [Diutina rugosa]KAA8897286.1 hypothetical protein DIURU_005263 [Diutina rugosa]
MAGIKKTSLRTKLNRRTTSVASKISEFHGQTETPQTHSNPLLRLATESKKEKRDRKSASFTERMMNKVTFNTGNGVSKSAARRQRRKARQQLKPNLNDLLTSLPDPATTTITKSGFIPPKQTRNPHAPTTKTQKGRLRVMKQENEQFKQVLQNQAFRQSPFAALREAIKNNGASA